MKCSIVFLKENILKKKKSPCISTGILNFESLWDLIFGLGSQFEQLRIITLQRNFDKDICIPGAMFPVKIIFMTHNPVFIISPLKQVCPLFYRFRISLS